MKLFITVCMLNLNEAEYQSLIFLYNEGDKMIYLQRLWQVKDRQQKHQALSLECGIRISS